MYEVEQKFKVADSTDVEAKLHQLQATFHAAIQQVDRYFAHPSRDFAATDEAFRIRQVGEHNYVTYKGPKIDPLTKTRREIELPLVAGPAHAEQFAELLQALSFSPAGIVRKTRRPVKLAFQDWQFEVALDEVEGLGAFVELEVTADESQLDGARECLHTLATILELAEVERRSYLELLLGE